MNYSSQDKQKNNDNNTEENKMVTYSLLLLSLLILGCVFLSGCELKNNEVTKTGEINQAQNIEQKDFQNSAAQTTLGDVNNNLGNVQQQENEMTNNMNNMSNIIHNEEIKAATEIEVGNFSTPLKSTDSNRLTNIELSCSKLNGTVVENEGRFSFNGTVGKATAEEGYKEADIIVNKKKEKGIGGGKCQVSTTLYNAADMIENVTVTERHEHGKDVTYVEDGRDAAVSYGGYDLEFENHTGKNLKIYASTDGNEVYVRIVKIES